MKECPHSRLECECNPVKEETVSRSLLEEIQDFAEMANIIASLLVGHRAILISGGIDPAVVDQMVYNLHSSTLGTRDSHDNFPFYEEEDE